MNDGRWKRVCGLAGAARTRERWRAELADVHPLLEKCLEKTGRPVRYVKCEECGCNHKVLRDDDAGYVAVCSCEGGCEPRRMTVEEARAWVLSGKALVELVAGHIPVEVRLRAVGGHGLWEVGTAWMKNGQRKTVLISLAGTRMALETGLADLFGHGLRRFVLVVSDGRWCGTALDPRLESVDGQVHGLGEVVEIGGGALRRGKLVGQLFADGPTSAKGTSATSKPYSLRKRGIKRYRAKDAKREMRMWAIRFRGAEFDLPSIVGSEYLVHLLLHRDRDMRPDELITALEGSGVATVSKAQAKDMLFDPEGALKVALQWQPDAGQEILDEAEIRRYEGMIKALGIAILEGGDDPAQSEELAGYRERQAELLAFLMANTKPGPGDRRLPKHFANDAFARQANLVAKHLRKALKCVQENDKELWNHLKDKTVLRYGESNCYRPEKGIVWQEISE